MYFVLAEVTAQLKKIRAIHKQPIPELQSLISPPEPDEGC